MSRKYEINYERAAGLVDGSFTQTQRYLRNLISNLTGDGEFADSLTEEEVFAEGRKIRRQAQRVYDAGPKDLKPRNLRDSRDFGKERQLELF